MASRQGARLRRACAEAAIGAYGPALEALDRAAHGDGQVAATALVVRAGVLREVGLHGRAAGDDDAALTLLPEAGWRALRAAVLAGRVADAVGSGAHAELAERLDSAEAAAARAGTWQAAVRAGWVTGEVAMVRGDFAAAGMAFAAAAERARDGGGVRAQAKGLAFAAAAAAALQDATAARSRLARARELAAACGARPLLWPIALIAAEVDPQAAAAHVDDARRRLRVLLDDLPEPLRAEALTRPPASWLLDV